MRPWPFLAAVVAGVSAAGSLAGDRVVLGVALIVVAAGLVALDVYRGGLR